MSATSRAVSSRLAQAEWLGWPETRRVFEAFSRGGRQARVVGGAVRDTLLGLEVREIDLATPARPETVMELAKKAGLKAVPTGLDHGTVTIVSGHRPFEVTTLRKDVETYGRRAKVAFTDDWAADARRRDFTINALYADADGALFDPLGAVADLAERRVRFIGDAAERIREDYLRILRFFRFNAQFGTPPYDQEGLDACVRERSGLGRLAPERVHGELARLLIAVGAENALQAMFDYGLLVDVLGGVVFMQRFSRLAAIEAELGKEPDAAMRLAALTLAAPEDAERLTKRFRLSNADRRRLEAAAGYRSVEAALDDQAAMEALYAAGPQVYRDKVLFAWAQSDAGASDARWRRLHGLPERSPAPEFPLKGADIVALGVPKGPRVGEILKQLETRWIAAGFQLDRDSLIGMARALAAAGKA